MNKYSNLKLYLLLIEVCNAVTIPPWTIEMAQQQGPNVCVVEDLPGTKYKLWTECKYWSPRLICGRKPILRYDCCGGYTRVQNENGCTGVNEIENVLETAKKMGAKEFVRYIEDSGEEHLFTKRTVTLFAPSDEALQELSSERLRKLSNWRNTGINPILLYHSTPGRLYSDKFKGNLLINSNYANAKLRINKFSSQIDTINCARILRKDGESTNGVVHIIDSLLDPDTWQSTDVAETISRDGRFNQMAKAIYTSGISEISKNVNQPVTIFVPSDEAFDSLSTDHLKRIMNDRTALKEMVRSHIIPHPLCISAITKDLDLNTLNEDSKINFGCKFGKYSLDNKTLSENSLLTPNGIIYPIDHVIIPDQAKTTLMLLDSNNTRLFKDVFTVSDLEKTLRHSKPYTMFVPLDEALLRLPYYYRQNLLTNKGEARRFVSRHTLKKKCLTEDIMDNEIQRTMDNGQSLVFQVYRKSFGVNGAIILEKDKQGLDCIIHLISRVITPTTDSLQDLLRDNSSYSLFLETLHRGSQYNPDILEKSLTKTVFIPTNQAFYSLNDQQLYNLRTDPSYLNQVLQNHIIDRIYSSEAIQATLQYHIRSRGKDLTINKIGDTLLVNGGEVLDCDISTQNGLVHTINKIILPEDY